MKSLNNYINEKFQVPKNYVSDDSDVIKTDTDTSYPNEYKGVNFIFDSQSWPNGHFTFTMEYVKEVLNKCDLNDKEEKFVQSIYDDFVKLKKRSWGSPTDKSDLINGDYPKFERAKFFYDMFNWVLRTHELTIPRKQKINKIMRYKGEDHIYYDFKPNAKQQQIIQNIKGLSWAE